MTAMKDYVRTLASFSRNDRLLRIRIDKASHELSAKTANRHPALAGIVLGVGALLILESIPELRTGPSRGLECLDKSVLHPVRCKMVRTASGKRANAGLVGTADPSDGFCPDPVGDAADAFDGNGDGVAVLEEQLGVSAVSGSGRRAREDDVSWFQGGEFGDGGDECGYVEDQVGEVGFLYHFSVQRCADAGLADVGFRGGDDVGPEWVVLSQALPCSHWWDLFW